jgi:hypothetical protein
MTIVNGMTREEMIAQTYWELDAEKAGIVTANRLSADHPHLRPIVIDGLLRQGETMNVIGASKAGKSWLIHGLAVSVANGLWWLGREVTAGRVLIIDNELHPETLVERLRVVTKEIGNGATLDNIDVMSLRGESDRADVIGLVQRLAAVKPDRYRLICIDALYRAIPPGTSESDNAQMMQVYNQLDRMARLTGAAIVVNHHATKGDQSGKAVTDVGSGAGSISRATDTHLVIRPHEEDDLCVLDAVTRSFAPQESRTIRFWWPLWETSGEEPRLRQAKTGQQRQQESKDAEGREAVLAAVGLDGAFAGSIRVRTGYGPGRVTRLLAMLKREGVIRGEVRPCKTTKEGQAMFYKPT